MLILHGTRNIKLFWTCAQYYCNQYEWLQKYLFMNVVPDVLEAVRSGGIVVHFDSFRQFFFQSTTEILTENKRKSREEELHNKQEDNKAEILKQDEMGSSSYNLRSAKHTETLPCTAVGKAWSQDGFHVRITWNSSGIVIIKQKMRCGVT